MKNKTVIFVGGTVRSGTTLLNLILANNEKSMALGEVFWIFNPVKQKHFEKIKQLKKDLKWKRIIDGGVSDLYKNLIHEFPHYDYFIDSSKNPYWYAKQSNYLRDSINYRNILIFKNPTEFYQSMDKRGHSVNWKTNYLNYHRRYFSLIKDFYKISYFDLINDEQKFQMILMQLGIESRSSIRNYWEKDHPYNFFGSNSVKLKNSHSESNTLNNYARKELVYDRVISNQIERKVKKELKNDLKLQLVYNSLTNDLNEVVHPKLLFNKYMLTLFLLKDQLTYWKIRILDR